MPHTSSVSRDSCNLQADRVECHFLPTLDLSPSRAGRHIGQCVSSNHLCPLLRREHLPRQFQTSQVFADGLRPIFSSVFLFPFSPRSPVQHLFGFSSYVHSGHMTQRRQSFPPDDAAQLLLSCSFPDYFLPTITTKWPANV